MPNRKGFGTRLKPALSIALAATLLAWLLQGALFPLDALLYDSGLASRPARVPDAIAICGIDEDFMEGRHAYLAPRDRLARLIDSLSAARPAAIGVDVWLDSRVDDGPAGGDAALQRALQNSQKRGVPVFLADVAPDQEQNGFASGTNSHGSVIPYFATAASGTGSVLLEPDADDVARTVPGWHGLIPLPFLMARSKSPGVADLADRLQYEPVPLDYDGPPGTVPTSPAVEFLQEPAFATVISGKLVFIGAVYPRSTDFVPTPYTRTGSRPMYGVEVLAQATDTLLRGAPRRSAGTPSSRLEILFAVLIVAGLVTLAAEGGAKPGIPAALAALLLAAFAAASSATNPGSWLGFAWPASPFFIAISLAAGMGIARRQWIGARELRLVRESFGAYVGSAVLRELGGKLPELGGENRRIAVLFCDIRGYSALAESMQDDPRRLMNELNDHFGPLVRALQERGAYVDNYVGDLVMALFGAPIAGESFEADVENAVLAALDFVSIVEERNAVRREAGQLVIEVGIGLHCGEALVGNLGTPAQAGHEGHIHYTAIGDVVNIASRVESATRNFGATLLVTEEMVAACAGRPALPAFEFVAETKVKGRTAPVRLYRPAGKAEEVSQTP